MDIEGLFKTAAAVLTPAGAVVQYTSRRRRKLAAVRDNLALCKEIELHDGLRDHTPVLGWLHGRIALDVASLTGTTLGTPKKPIDKGTVGTGLGLGALFGAWTWYLVKDGFVWYSVFPATLAVLMAVSILGHLSNRQLPPDETFTLPSGAVAMAGESYVADVVNASVTHLPENIGPQAATALAFLAAARAGNYEFVLELVEPNWLLCRVQSWLWNHAAEFGDTKALSALATSLSTSRDPAAVWAAFVESETRQFGDAWASFDPARMGVASRRRRVGPEHDLIILAPIGTSRGYFVTSTTAVPDSLPILLHYSGDRWLVASHLGSATPLPGLPPTWWTAHDPAIDALPG